MTYPVIHWQMLSADPDATSSFYADLFGWSFSEANGLGYRSVQTKADGGLDGGVWPVPKGSPETVQLYVQVPDIDAALEQVQALGGRMLMPRQILPDGDAIALAVDPLGRALGLMTPRSNAADAD